MVGVVLEGVVTPGLGKGAVFMSIDYYKNEIKDKLGFEAYPGTLNIKVGMEQIKLLKNIEKIRIERLIKNNKTFGGISCYKGKINNINGSIIVPDLTEHGDIIEFIAPDNLKVELNIKDGDKIKIQLL